MAGRFSSVALAAAASLLPWSAAQGEFPWRFPVKGSTVCAGGRTWDGFGVNYVEAAQTRNYSAWKQDYGGFSILQDADKQAILELIFGSQGLQIPLIKSFLDVWHEGQCIGDNDNSDPYTIDMAGYDHVTSTSNLRYFLRAAANLSALTHTPLAIIVGLYGPQTWASA